MKTLLHVCCGPCASACVPVLKGKGREVTLLFANSNIDTREEFERRLEAARKLAAADGVELVALPYDHADWLEKVAKGYEHEPEKGARCARCFRYNLTQTARYAMDRGFDDFTSSLTVSPLKDRHMILAKAHEARSEVLGGGKDESALKPAVAEIWFYPYYQDSIRRSKELGLYRQNYCGCEFSKARWKLHHQKETASTNLDARKGVHRDVFTADFQTAGRGRLDHVWQSPPETNLLMSAVFAVGGLSPEMVATLPLVAGLAVAKALGRLMRSSLVSIKWPNDVLVEGRKIAGILCERNDDKVIVGIGVNVRQREFPPELGNRATSVFLNTGREMKIAVVRNVILDELGKWYGIWHDGGFVAVYQEISALDGLKGQTLAVRQTDGDAEPLRGVSGGIRPDGALDVGGTPVWAGEVCKEV